MQHFRADNRMSFEKIKNRCRWNDPQSHSCFQVHRATYMQWLCAWRYKQSYIYQMIWCLVLVGSSCHSLYPKTKLYIPSTLNIDPILWHTQLIVCAENVKSWFKSWVISFTFQAYTLPHALNCIYVSLFKFHIWILKQF